jgi:hypothetical protein
VAKAAKDWPISPQGAARGRRLHELLALAVLSSLIFTIAVAFDRHVWTLTFGVLASATGTLAIVAKAFPDE